MNDATTKKPGFYGWKNVMLLFIIYMAGFGMVFYGFVVIFPAMIKTLNWSRGTASIAHTLFVLGMGLLIPLVAISLNKIGAKKTITIGAAILLIGLIFMGTVMNQMWQWILLWGIIVPLGFGFAGIVPTQTMVLYWFNVKRATALGIVMTSAAIGGFLAQPFYAWLIAVTNSWQIGWLCSAVFAFIAMVCSFFLISKPEDVGQYPDGLTAEELEKQGNKIQNATRTYRTSREWELNEVFKTPAIWFIMLVGLGYVLPLIFITSHGVLHFLDKGFTQMQAASILAFLIMGSGLIRFPAGWLGDRIEPRWILAVTLGVMLVMFLFLWKSSNYYLLVTVGVIFGICYGSQLIMFPTIMGNYYGAKVFAGINGVTGPTLIVFAASVPMGSGYIYENMGSYDMAIIIVSVFIGMGFLSSLFLAPPKS